MATTVPPPVPMLPLPLMRFQLMCRRRLSATIAGGVEADNTWDTTEVPDEDNHWLCRAKFWRGSGGSIRFDDYQQLVTDALLKDAPTFGGGLKVLDVYFAFHDSVSMMHPRCTWNAVLSYTPGDDNGDGEGPEGYGFEDVPVPATTTTKRKQTPATAPSVNAPSSSSPGLLGRVIVAAKRLLPAPPTPSIDPDNAAKLLCELGHPVGDSPAIHFAIVRLHSICGPSTPKELPLKADYDAGTGEYRVSTSAIRALNWVQHSAFVHECRARSDLFATFSLDVTPVAPQGALPTIDMRFTTTAANRRRKAAAM